MNTLDLVISECDLIKAGAGIVKAKLKELNSVPQYNSGQKTKIILDAFKAGLAAETQAIIQHINEVKKERGIIGTNEELLDACNKFFDMREAKANEGAKHVMGLHGLSQVEGWNDNSLNIDCALHKVSVMTALKN